MVIYITHTHTHTHTHTQHTHTHTTHTHTQEDDQKRLRHYSYPKMVKHLGNFKMDVSPGEFTASEIIVMLGENGTGKTTFIRLMAGLLKPDSGGECVYD